MTDILENPPLAEADPYEQYKQSSSRFINFFPLTLEPLSQLAKNASLPAPPPFKGYLKIEDIGDEGIEMNVTTSRLDAEINQDNLCTIIIAEEKKEFRENCERLQEMNPLFYRVLQLIDDQSWKGIYDNIKQNDISISEHTYWIDRIPRVNGSTTFNDGTKCEFNTENLQNFPVVYNCYQQTKLNKPI